MAYAKPNTFSDGTTLVAASVRGNVDALRIYLHNGIVQADLLNSKWIDTRHIQPPRYDAVQGVQHGVTGYQGGQWGGNLVNMSFVTSFTSGSGRDSHTGDWRRVPNTSFDIHIRRNAKILLHWSVEVEGGPDDMPAVTGRTPAIADGFNSSSPFGPDRPYTTLNGYGRRTGVLAAERNAGTRTTIGLCSWSEIDRSAVVNWSIGLEIWYL